MGIILKVVAIVLAVVIAVGIIGTLIGVGAEFVGDMMKGMLSPNSPETVAVELERTRR